MKNIYLFILLFCSFINTSLAQEKIIDLPFPVENLSIKTYQQLNNHYPFKYSPRLVDNFFWAYDNTTNNLVAYTTEEQIGLDIISTDNGIYWAAKLVEQQFQEAQIDLYRHTGISGQEAEIIFSRIGNNLSILGFTEQQVYFEVNNSLFILDEQEGSVSEIGYAQNLRKNGLFWKNAYYWIYNREIWKANREGISLVINSDFAPRNLTPLGDWLIWQSSVMLFRYDGISNVEPLYSFSPNDLAVEISLSTGASLGDSIRFFFST